MLMRFLADKTLGRLARWLRALGYDTADYGGAIDRAFLNEAWKEGRIALTRKRDMAERDFRGTLIIVAEDRVQDQISTLLKKLELKPRSEDLFTICLNCNIRLAGLTKEEVKESVPQYVFATQDDFSICPTCRKIYWPGTHRERAWKFVQAAIH